MLAVGRDAYNPHKREILLFLAAILVPAGVLIGLTSRILYQDRELAAKRAVDQRRAAVNQLRRELSSRLETIKLQEINRLMRSPISDSAHHSENPRCSSEILRPTSDLPVCINGRGL